MKSRSRNLWTALAVLGLLAWGGALVLCRATPGCLVGSRRETPADQRVGGNRAATSEPGEPATQVNQGSGGEMMSRVDAHGRIEYADEASFDRLVLQSDVPVLVDFYADWCAPCRMLAPIVEQVAQEAPHAKVVKVDVDQNPGLAERYRINSIPSVIVFRDGQIVARHVGLADKADLKSMLEG
jgi:thioredoxin 1